MFKSLDSEYVTIHCKRDFEDVMKLRILRWGDHPGLSRWIQFNYVSPSNSRTFHGSGQKRGMLMEAGSERCSIAGFEDGGKGP